MAKGFDIAIAGGGLAGSLIALALAARRPDLSVALVEQGQTVGGNHIWSFFATDVAPQDRTLADALCSTQWDDGYDVRFPAYARGLSAGYRSVTSLSLAARVAGTLPPGHVMTGHAISGIDPGGISLSSGSRVEARGVIDARGLTPDLLRHLRGGWQKFVGTMVRTAAPHGLERPVVMDAGVEQLDGYRFVYCLPFSDCEVFVEDTCYSDSPALDRAAMLARIADYARTQGWEIAETTRTEHGMLPVVSGGNFDAFWQAGDCGTGRAGVRAGLFQPLTSYSFPDALRFASLVAALPALDSASLAAFSRDHARQHWKRGAFFRMLAKMLFGACAPTERYRVLQRFYGLDETLIQRFYAGESTVADKLRVLIGRPPVPIGTAALVLAGFGAPGALEGA